MRGYNKKGGRTVNFALRLIIVFFCVAKLCALSYKAGKKYGRVEGYNKAMEDIKKQGVKSK